MKTGFRAHIAWMAVSVVGLASFGARVTAQTAAPATNDTGGEIAEIVVTAAKRSQRLSDVGLTITAETGEQLQSAGVTDVAQLTEVVSGFSAAQTFEGYTVFSLRGVNFNSSQLSAPPTVTTYIDEAALPYPAMTGGLLLDVERIEVLKGPQGTLFGQNATGGSVNVIAAKPTSTPEEGFKTEINNFGQVWVEGYASGPLSQALSARFAVNTTQFGAWQKPYHIGSGKNGDQDKAAARLLLDWHPTDQLTATLNLNGNYDHSERIMPQLSGFIIANPANAAPGLIGYPLPTSPRDADIDPGFNTHKDDGTYQAVGRIDYKLSSDLTVTSLTDFADTHIFTPLNQDGTAIVILQGDANGTVNIFNQEIRATGQVPAAGINYIVGANYGRDHIEDNDVSNSIALSTAPPNFDLDAQWTVKNTAKGVFGNIDYEVVHGITLTGGVRYADTEQEINGCTFADGFCATVKNVRDSQSQDNVSWRAGLNFKPNDDTLIYGLVSRGYKAGLFPAVFVFSPEQVQPVRQEELTSYELGAKLALLDRRLQFNASVFYYDYIDKQFFTYTNVAPIGAVNTIVNIPTSSVKGLDAEVTLHPIDRLTLHSALTYVKTEVGAYSGTGAGGNLINFTGKEFNFAPPISAIADAEYRTPVSTSLTAVFGANALYNSTAYADLGENPETRLPSYATFDLRTGVESVNGWRIGLFVRNLADRYYWTSVFNGGDTLVKLSGMPRTYGMSGAVKF